MKQIKFSKIRDVKLPERGTVNSAGIDFYVPEFTGTFLRDFNLKNIVTINLNEELIKLSPNERVNIPSGIRCSIPYNTALIAFNKSGVSTKLGLDILACVIDSDYQGEIHLSLVNTSNEYVNIYQNQKLVQFVLLNVNIYDIIEVNDSEIFNEVTTRGNNGFGSTDNKQIKGE